MEWVIFVEWEAIQPDRFMVATAFDLSLEAVVTGVAQRLPVGPIPEEFQVASVRLDMVHTLSRNGAALILMEPA